MAGTNLISQFDYVLDGLGRRVERVDLLALTNLFGYNTRSEIISAVMPVLSGVEGPTNMFGYSYDSIGNRLWATANLESNDYTANNLNQYFLITNRQSEIGNDLGYDLDGNLTNDGQWAYTWDSENRMIAAETVGTAVPAVRLKFAYDYQGRRVSKVVEHWDGASWVSQSTNLFVYDGWNLISEICNTESQITTNTYIWGLDLSGSLQGAGGIGGLLCVTRSTFSGTATYFPCFDANGNVTDYVDTNGVTVAHREYDAFGNTIVATGPMVNDFHFWFSTKYLDEETGLYYYGYRYYSPSLGRWLNRDPIGEMAFLRDSQHYEYVMQMPRLMFLLNDLVFINNDPLGKLDFLGLINAALINNTGSPLFIIMNVKMSSKCRSYLEEKHPPLECANINGIPMAAYNGFDSRNEYRIEDVDGYWTTPPPGTGGFGIKIRFGKTVTAANVTKVGITQTKVDSLADVFSGGSFQTHVNITWGTTYRATVMEGLKSKGCLCTKDDLDNLDWAIARGQAAIRIFPKAK